MKLDCSSFEKALAQLEKSVGFLNSDAYADQPDLKAQFRAAAIQAFEFTYELAVKMIRRQLAQIVAAPAELGRAAFMDLMRQAADAGLIREAPPFRLYREMRNLTSHAYDENLAERLMEVIVPFLADMRFLLGELKRRNEETN